MVDLAKLKDLTPLMCKCGRIMALVLYKHPDGLMHIFVYCPNSRCRRCYDVNEHNEKYRNLYNVHEPKLLHLRTSLRKKKEGNGEKNIGGLRQNS